jgi:hypothetical protein
VDLGLRVLEFEVTEVPPGRISRKDAVKFYRMLSRNPVELDDKE